MTAKPSTMAGYPPLDEVRETPLQPHILHVPSMHCAGCIGKIEQHMNALAGVASARVNLSRKELRVMARDDIAVSDLIKAMAAIGFDADAIDPAQLQADNPGPADAMLKRLAVAGFGMMNVMLLSVSVWSGADAATRQFLHLVSALISLPILVYSAQPFLANAFRALRTARLNMDVPISLAIVLAAMMSLYESLTGGAHAYFDAALSLTFFLLAGRYLDLKARQKARSAAAQLVRMQTPIAYQRKDGKIIEIAVSALAPGMVIVTRPGERIPADGVIIKGKADVDRSLLTGEAVPLSLAPGREVFAGETCLNGLLEIRVTKSSKDSFLSRFIDLVDIAERGRHRYSSLADRAASIYAPLVHILALAAFAFWMWATGDAYHALTIAIAVLIITCPCALGLAVPAMVTAASGQLFAHGVLLKNASALERLAEIDTVIFDKTGTLTNGKFRPESLDGWGDAERDLLLELASASRHPLAIAITDALPPAGGARLDPSSITEVPGCGMVAKVDGKIVKLGRPEWISGKRETDTWDRRLGFRIGRGAIRWLDFAEEIRPDVTAMLDRLDEAGITRILLTGDNEHAASAMAARLGFTSHHAGMTPLEKQDFIKRMKAGGASVLMVGDGLNDTGAMATADAAVAPASALDAARATADVVLLGGHLKALPYMLDVAKNARRRILQNFSAAALYNLIALPLAFAGLATPLLAAIAMSASSITVVLNAVRPGLGSRGAFPSQQGSGEAG
ncbi:heavy metal translocating P-type ATPase [Alphaproteobacteria bacterium LSUCC0684]